MQKYLILQPNHSEIDDGTAYQISRSNVDVIRETWDNGNYRDAGYIKAENLNEVFRIGNTEPEEIEKVGEFYSISCGDLIVDPSNQTCHLVSPIGFTRLGYDPHFGKVA